MTDFIKNINTPIQFTDKSTNSPTSWSWSFGDDNTSTLQNPTHTYTTSGIYIITETVSNSCGTSIPITKTIQIQQPLTTEMGGTSIKIVGIGLLLSAIYLYFKNKKKQ